MVLWLYVLKITFCYYYTNQYYLDFKIYKLLFISILTRNSNSFFSKKELYVIYGLIYNFFFTFIYSSLHPHSLSI